MQWITVSSYEELSQIAADRIAALMKRKPNAVLGLATGSSPIGIYERLRAAFARGELDFSKACSINLDEYLGLAPDHPQSYRFFMQKHLFDHINIPSASTFVPNGCAKDPEAECLRYSELLTKYPTDIVFLGIGENAHIAFNDPWIADFNDPKLVKLVPLDEVCRNQQVHDGCFPTLDDVPTHAFSLTVPALVKAKHMFCTVPCATKAEAVYLTATAPINEEVPATAMRNHPHAVMYCDKESGAKLL